MNHNTTDQNDITECYRRAEAFSRDIFSDFQEMGTENKIAFNTTVVPNWINDTDCFCYRHEWKNGKEFRLVDPAAASNEPAFDHGTLGSALSKASGKALNGEDLPIINVNISLSPLQVRFEAFGKHWMFDSETKQCSEEVKLQADNSVLSPDGCSAVFLRQCNLWIRDIASGEEKPLTHDGERYYCYATTAAAYGRQESISLEAIWSPDSKRLFSLIKDSRLVKIGPPLVRHVPPKELGVRPDIMDPHRRVALPGDEHVEEYRLLSIDITSGEIQGADYQACPVIFQHYLGFFTGGRGWWAMDSRHAYFTDCERGGRVARLLKFDTYTGETRVLIEEKSETRFKFVPIAHLGVVMKPLPEGKEVVWYSERSGWPHLYLYDLETGKLKNTITQGPWLVRNVLHYDADRRELIIKTAGRIPDRNPYYRDICRVNVDTSELTSLTSSDHEYFTCDPIVRGSVGSLGVSPSGNYIVTTRSRVNTVPVSLLLDKDGKEILELETADVSGLPSAWQWPEPVMLTAADGETDLYGVVFRPSDFSAEKSYPILDFSSFMTHAPIGSFTNSYSSTWSYYTAAAYAELGFIVVIIINRGTELRGSAFENDKDAPLGYCFHQDDCIAGIKQLAERYSYMDIDRVGLGGYPNPPTVLSGLLRYPEFYKVGVSDNAASDSRLLGDHVVEHFTAGGSWSEDLSEYHLEHYAHQLRGKLLLAHGMLDNTVPVASTFRIVEALQQANKDFDMLLLPNYGHGISSYVMRRTWDYLVRHLQGIEPPKEFKLTDQLDMADGTQHLYEEVAGA